MNGLADFFANFDPLALARVLAYDEANPLFFNTGLFLLLFLALIGIYALARRHHSFKMVVVIAFSLYFYYKSSARYCLILVGVCVSDYLLGLWMGRAQQNWQRRLIVVINVVANIGMLVYFKYFNLIYQTVANISGTHFDAMDIVLPAGISFFTFRSISYIVDIYRRKIEPCRNFLDYMFFLTFFPPLLAGPVVRAADMLPQIADRDRVATRAMVAEGFFLIMSGLIKKVVIADYISEGFVDRVFENPSLYSGLENVIGAIGFTLQLYCDFSGYSDMAIGIALLLGYRFADNFNAPFKAQNPTEFWRRWHISLSTWLRDYLYIPMGGNRKGKRRTYFNNFATMVIGGIWHGAGWMYALWGAMHGLMLIGHKATRNIDRPAWLLMPPERLRRIANIFVTFTLVVIAFTIFRCATLGDLQAMGRQVFTAFHPEVFVQFARAYALILTAIGVGFAMHFAPSAWRKKLLGRYIALPIAVQAVILGLVIFVVIQTRRADLVPFVYLQY